MANTPKNTNKDAAQTAPNYSVFCFTCFIIFGVLCIWSFPNPIFLSFAVVSSSVAWTSKYCIWRKRSPMQIAAGSLILLIPYWIAREMIDISTHRLLLVKYLLLSIGTFAGLLSLFRNKLERSKPDA
jgi:hypothetical protein